MVFQWKSAACICRRSYLICMVEIQTSQHHKLQCIVASRGSLKVFSRVTDPRCGTRRVLRLLYGLLKAPRNILVKLISHNSNSWSTTETSQRMFYPGQLGIDLFNKPAEQLQWQRDLILAFQMETWVIHGEEEEMEKTNVEDKKFNMGPLPWHSSLILL